jgi:hypothetical protein
MFINVQIVEHCALTGRKTVRVLVATILDVLDVASQKTALDNNITKECKMPNHTDVWMDPDTFVEREMLINRVIAESSMDPELFAVTLKGTVGKWSTEKGYSGIIRTDFIGMDERAIREWFAAYTIKGARIVNSVVYRSNTGTYPKAITRVFKVLNPPHNHWHLTRFQSFRESDNLLQDEYGAFHTCESMTVPLG